MATPAQLEALTTLPVPQLEEQYLRLMVGLARDMERGQTSEIDALDDLLVARGLSPEPVDAQLTGARGGSPRRTTTAEQLPGSPAVAPGPGLSGRGR